MRVGRDGGASNPGANWVAFALAGKLPVAPLGVAFRSEANSSGLGADLISRAGTPTTVVIGSTLHVTTAPAPTMASKPMRTF